MARTSNNRFSLFQKNLLISSFNIFLIGVILTFACYKIQGNLLAATLNDQALGFTKLAYSTLDLKDIKDSLSNSDVHSETQQRLIKQLNDFSALNPKIAQTYIIDTDKTDGVKLFMAAVPQHLLDEGLKVGDYFETSPLFAEQVEKAKNFKSPFSTDIYTDSIGVWLSVLVPVIDESGKVIAVFGIDQDASMVAKGQMDLIKTALIIFAIALVVVFFFQFFVMRKLLLPIKQLVAGMKEVSRGNLTVRLAIKQKDELGDLAVHFNEMVEQNRTMIQKIQEHTEHSASTAEQLSASVEEVSQQVNQITTTIQEVASGAINQLNGTAESSIAINEMASGIQRIAESTSTVSEVSLVTSKEVQEGSASIQKAVSQMESMKASVEHSGTVVKSLGERSQEIAHILEIITGIASQTNLLALNAAIEAARAGEQGRGFSVVADEVRKLAEQSNESASQIAHLIQEIQLDTAKAVAAMDTVSQEVHTGLQAVQQAGQTFARIADEITHIAEQIQESSAVAEQMSASSEQVSASIDETAAIAKLSADHAQHVATASSEQLTAMEQLAASAESLSRMAQESSELVKQYQV